MVRILIIFFALIISFSDASKAQPFSSEIPLELSDSAHISVLTSAPWAEEAYAVFGHSAMRVYDPVYGIDIVFNYGLFDFNSPNFIYRFTAGETDYMVGAVSFKRYLPEYEYRGVAVHEQIINLTTAEKQKIWTFLLTNAEPENRVYRYNIFYNNCTTKLADIIEQNIDGKVIYPQDTKSQTIRNMLYEHIDKQPWLMFGIDLVIGSGADKPITIREKIFLPAYEMDIFDQSHILNSDGTTRPLVLKKNLILEDTNSDIISENNFISSPLFVGLILLAISVLVSIYGYKKKRAICTAYDFILFLTAGIGGCIIFFMMFFSVHPCTNPNWNIVWLNPLQFIFAFLFFAKSLSKCVYYYHFINFAVLIVFLLAWCLIPQQLEIAFIPIILAIALRSGMRVLQYKKLKQKAG
ncbi:DUF4105 domain-containing protein [Dysgonomonas sp. ZJ709]|uniref:lipoprotein N-acyltransferase Lnb domain-containing protein n=1 Tax=Dysgonomonas sp. ZJ709 TaxID=2709797 RepID=UPI0013EAFF84|nr:DUF4105 domain-containing protein [Dysgonomonas sp. ZJ709]